MQFLESITRMVTLTGIVGVIESYVAGHYYYDDDDDILTASAKQTLGGIKGQLLASVPFLRTLSSGLTFDDYSLTPLSSPLKSAGHIIKDIEEILGGDLPDKMDMHIAELLGVSAHIPHKPYNATRYLFNVMRGDEDLPDTFNLFEWFRTLQRGYSIDPNKAH